MDGRNAIPCVSKMSHVPLWSMVVVESKEAGFEIQAGKKGLEALILQYPIEDE